MDVLNDEHLKEVAIIPEDVERLFEELTLQLIGRGHKHYSARAILHRIRWHHHVELSDPTFKVNNNLTPTLARNFHEKYREHDDFFALRRSPYTSEHNAWMRPDDAGPALSI